MYANLYTEMKKRKVRQKQLAKLIGVTDRAIFNKLSGKSKFDSSEMITIQEQFFPNSDLKTLFTED